ncbi:hypothetical protein A5652_11235 [Mycobacterium sp. 1165178.9]|nr:hypothetical protein A5652_11235 [Mycobacterium sp. 1165178.9]
MSTTPTRLAARCSLFAAVFLVLPHWTVAHADPAAPAPEPVLQPLAPGQVLRTPPGSSTDEVSTRSATGAYQPPNPTPCPAKLSPQTWSNSAGNSTNSHRSVAPMP